MMENYDGYIVLVAEYEQFKGRRLQVYIDSDIDKFWTNFPDVNDLNLKIVKPKDVENIILQAIKKGWNPKEKGFPVVFGLTDEGELINRI